MDSIVTVCLLGFALIFGIIFEDILKWFGFDFKENDMATIILFFPAFFFLIAFWIQPFLLTGIFALNDITKISSFFDGLYLWIASALFAGSGLRLLFNYFYNKSE